MDSKASAMSTIASVLSKAPIGNILRYAAQATAALTLAGFTISVIANSIIFRDWGLNFLQIATPTDVVLSGFSIAIGMLPALVVVLISYPISHFVWKISSNTGRLSSIVGALFIFGSIITGAYFLLSSSSFAEINGSFYSIRVFDYDYYNWMLYCFFISNVFWFIIIDSINDEKKQSLGRVALAANTIVVLLLPYLAYGSAVVQNGFVGQEMAGRVSGIQLCEPNRVLWMGSQNIVIQCTDLPDQPITILRNPDGLQLLPSATEGQLPGGDAN